MTVTIYAAPIAMERFFSVVISEVVAAETVKEIGKIETETAMTSLGILLC